LVSATPHPPYHDFSVYDELIHEQEIDFQRIYRSQNFAVVSERSIFFAFNINAKKTVFIQNAVYDATRRLSIFIGLVMPNGRSRQETETCQESEYGTCERAV
jgi:hypothetical protein